MSAADDSAFAHARRRVRNEIYFDQRRLVDVADGVGIIAVSIGVPFLLWDPLVLFAHSQHSSARS